MKKITYIDLENQIILEKGIFYNITIMNQSMYYNFIKNLIDQINMNESNGFVLSKEDKELSMKKNCKIITNPFDLVLNNRKTINLLYHYINDQLLLTEFNNKLMQFETEFNKLLNEIKLSLDTDIDYDDEIDILSILKFANVNPHIEGDSFTETLVKYISFVSKLEKIYVFFLINLKSLLSEPEMDLFIKEMNLKHIDIINIDNYILSNQYNINYVNIIIDEDLCEIKRKLSI